GDVLLGEDRREPREVRVDVASLGFHLPDCDPQPAHEFRLSEATFLVGNITLEGNPTFEDPVFAGPRAATATGRLTVCPNVFEANGVVRPVVLSGLAA